MQHPVKDFEVVHILRIPAEELEPESEPEPAPAMDDDWVDPTERTQRLHRRQFQCHV